jgi:spermidine synthase
VTILLALLFIFSGAAGLVYESLWSRYLGLLVGHGAYAQVLVLVIFLGGMSLGAALIARRTAAIRNPLLWYAAVEAIVGVLALVFHDVFVATSGFAYTALFPALGDGGIVTFAKWTLAALLILPQSILLGTTFPLMSAGVLRRSASARAGHVLGLLYFANSLGAATGVLIAGFWLLEHAGLPGTLAIAAMVNLGVALVSFLIARRDDALPIVSSGDAPADARPALWSLLLWVSFATAVASLFYDIAWIRIL